MTIEQIEYCVCPKCGSNDIWCEVDGWAPVKLIKHNNGDIVVYMRDFTSNLVLGELVRCHKCDNEWEF